MARALPSALASFDTLVYQGKIPSSIQIHPFFSGASLTALSKKEGGIRPIAVGCILCRPDAIVSGSMQCEGETVDLLVPCQLGYGAC